MRPLSVYANGSCPAGCACDLVRLPHGPHRLGARLVMVLLPHRGWPPAAIAELLACDPVTVRRWIHRYNQRGVDGLCDQPRPGRPRLGSPRPGERIVRLLAEPKAWTMTRLWQRLGRHQCRCGPSGAVVLAEDEPHLNLLLWLRATGIVHGAQQPVMTPGQNQRPSVFGAVDLRTGGLPPTLGYSCCTGPATTSRQSRRAHLGRAQGVAQTHQV